MSITSYQNFKVISMYTQESAVEVKIFSPSYKELGSIKSSGSQG